MTLFDDLDELSLLVPDAPSLQADVERAGRALGAKAAALVQALIEQQAEAAELAGRIDAALAGLRADAQAIQKMVGEVVEGLVPQFRDVRARLAAERASIGAAEAATTAAVQALGGRFVSATTLLASTRSQATESAGQQGERLTEGRDELHVTVVAAGESVPQVAAAVEKATDAIEKAVSSISSQLTRLGPLAAGHLTDAVKDVREHIDELSLVMHDALGSYGSGADALAEQVVVASVAAGAELAAAGEALATTTFNAAELVLGSAQALAARRESFVEEQVTLQGHTDRLTPLMDAADRADLRMGAR